MPCYPALTVLITISCFRMICYIWEEAILLQQPKYPWEFVQIGNAGSPIETDKGWLVITHGVGAMRKYCLGASLFDINDPSIELGAFKGTIFNS